ncbi:MAG TPA: YceI family protein [Longimicrobiaceae bacterium]|nr:YceI family protein [Longimicrobiaceae bacterium]
MQRSRLVALTLPAGLLLAATAMSAPRSTAPLRARPAATGDAPIRYAVAGTGNEARYRLHEKLVGMELPYDAVGATSAITGTIAFDAQGRLVPAESKLVINVTGLKSDKEKRDGYVQRRLLDTAEFPTVEFAPTSVRGLPAPLPTSGERSFQMVGNLTVKGVTRPTTWNVRAAFQGDQVTGNAYTTFTFDDFKIDQPHVPVILSLADTIRLEYDFALQRASAGTP